MAGGDAEGELAGVDTLGVSGSLSRLACRPGSNAWVVMSRRSWSAGAKVAPRVYRGARYVTVSEASKSDLVALGVRERDIAIVENGVDPIPGENTVAKGRASVRMHRDPVAVAREWRDLAEAKNLTTRELIIEVTGRQSFVGSPQTIAHTINGFVQADVADGFILVPHIVPGGLDRFVDEVVPVLQELGVYRSDYEGSTLRDNLGLARPGG